VAQVAHVRLAPVGGAGVTVAVAQEEALERFLARVRSATASSLARVRSRMPRRLVRDMDGRQLASAVQARQLNGVAPVVFW